VPKLRRKFSEKEIARAYASLAGSPGGEIVLWDLRDRYIERTSLDPGGDATKTVANEGKRFVVLEIFSKIEEGELTYGERLVDAVKPERTGGSTEVGFDVFGDGERDK
jgi:hypothetical protein